MNNAGQRVWRIYNGEVDYLLWKHRDTTKWILDYKDVKGAVDSHRQAKYDGNDKLVECFLFNENLIYNPS